MEKSSFWSGGRRSQTMRWRIRLAEIGKNCCWGLSWARNAVLVFGTWECRLMLTWYILSLRNVNKTLMWDTSHICGMSKNSEDLLEVSDACANGGETKMIWPPWYPSSSCCWLAGPPLFPFPRQKIRHTSHMRPHGWGHKNTFLININLYMLKYIFMNINYSWTCNSYITALTPLSNVFDLPYTSYLEPHG